MHQSYDPLPGNHWMISLRKNPGKITKVVGYKKPNTEHSIAFSKFFVNHSVNEFFDRSFATAAKSIQFDDSEPSLLSYTNLMDGRTFTLAEAKQLLPQLEERLLAVKQEKEVLVRSHGEVKRASAKAQMNGGSFAGPGYIRALERISDSVESIQEMGVLVRI